MSSKYDVETRARAVRLVRDHVGDYESEFAAIRAVAGRLGMSTEALRRWVRQAEVDSGEAPGVTSESAREIRELKRKNAELEQTIEILKAATSFFVRECDPHGEGFGGVVAEEVGDGVGEVGGCGEADGLLGHGCARGCRPSAPYLEGACRAGWAPGRRCR